MLTEKVLPTGEKVRVTHEAHPLSSDENIFKYQQG